MATIGVLSRNPLPTAVTGRSFRFAAASLVGTPIRMISEIAPVWTGSNGSWRRSSSVPLEGAHISDASDRLKPLRNEASLCQGAVSGGVVARGVRPLPVARAWS